MTEADMAETRITNDEILTAVRMNQVEIVTMQKQISKTVEELSLIIKGNGKPGLAKTVECVERDVTQHLREHANTLEELKTRKQQRLDISWKLIMAVITPTVANIIIMLISILKGS